MKSIELSLLAIAAVLAGGCMSVQLYDGPKRDRDEVARITGDPVVTAGSPVTVILRQVDGRDIGVSPLRPVLRDAVICPGATPCSRQRSIAPRKSA